jgi:methylmalonyl-CoA mutase
LIFPEKNNWINLCRSFKRKKQVERFWVMIRMNAINNPRVYMRSLATRQSNLALSKYVADAIQVIKAAILLWETSGIGQSDTEIMDHSDVSLYVMTQDGNWKKN